MSEIVSEFVPVEPINNEDMANSEELEFEAGTTISGWELSGKPYPRMVAGAKTLREQINEVWPNRSKEHDGWLGDGLHQSRLSDHNPDSRGLVHALDIDIDLRDSDSRRGQAAEKLANELIDYVKKAIPGSERIKYVIFNNRIASGDYNDRYWVWREGDWGCLNHIHIGFNNIGESDSRAFSLSILGYQRGSSLIGPNDSAMPKYPGKKRLQYGQTNESVRKLQRQLISKGYNISNGASANYDEETRIAVKSLYHKMSKNTNGKDLGPSAWVFLFGE